MNMGTKLELYIIRTNDVLPNINKLSDYFWDGLKILILRLKHFIFLSWSMKKNTVTCEMNLEFFILTLFVKLWDIA